MNRAPGLTVFALGLAAVAWVGWGYVGANPLGLTMTALIGACYLAGALELLRFDQATSSLRLALSAIPDKLSHLGAWLGRVHPSLQNPVRLRIEGERVGLPGPAMTPYLVGLLVLLGMLGTFLGMVVTLNGAVLAIESTADLPAIRAALTAPVKGLGLAFGTSIAGVAASAMLGLLSALCRRARLHAAQGLDSRIATDLRAFSLAHQREETLKALQGQARALPDVAQQLQGLIAQLGDHSLALNAQLLAQQERFHQQAQAAYSGLAASVEQSLRHSLDEGVRATAAAVQPFVERTLASLAQESTRLHESLARSAELQQGALAARLGSQQELVTQALADSLARDQQLQDERSRILQGLGGVLDGVQQGLAEQRGAIDALVTSSAQLLHEVGTRFAASVDAGSVQLNAVAAQLTGSALEVASLGEAFGFGVQRFSAASDGLIATLQRIEASLNKSTARSDEQLAYYVAQAREIIDLSILSQKQIVEDLQQFARQAAPPPAEVG